MKFKIRKGTNVFITFLACVVSIYLLRSNFGLTTQEIIHYGAILFGLLLALLAVAALISLGLRLFYFKHTQEFFDDDDGDNNEKP